MPQPSAIALAPELDRQYVRIYAILQDDMSKKRPTVELALNLLCSTFYEKLSQGLIIFLSEFYLPSLNS